MSQLVIFRGLPGAGKSTAARDYQAKTGAILIEPDALCVSEGEYHWTPERWAAAVELAAVTIEMLTGGEFDREGAAMRPDIIYADVLPTAAEIQAVIDHVPREYAVTVLTLSSAKGKSVHRVKPEDYRRMRDTFEAVCFYHGRVVSEGRMYETDKTDDANDGHCGQSGLCGHRAEDEDGAKCRQDRRNAAEGGVGK